MEIDSIVYDINSQFHMLRHFEKPDEQLINIFLQNGYSIDVINSEFQQPGSKFYSNFARNIDNLLVTVKQQGFQLTKGLNGNTILVSNLSALEFPGGIGTVAVIPFETLSEAEKSRIVYKENRQLELAHLQVDHFPVTYTFCLILKKMEATYQFITAFPGEPAMPLPDERMESNLYKEAKAYWDAHVFLFTSE